MKRKVSRLRLSPNEEARIIREEHERRRKLRIQQVREQQRHIAQQIRRAVEERRRHELQQLEEELRTDWERQQRQKLHTLQRFYQESLQLLGQSHRSAKENEPDLAAIAQREEENHVKAEERYREALKELKSQRLKNHERQNQSINARKKALQTEKERSSKIASLPPPPPDPIQNIDLKKSHVVKKSDVSAFAATHYHMPESIVDRRVDTEQPCAREEAELEARRLQDIEREEKRRREEQLEKARIRGRQALRKEQLVQDRERLLVELEHMQQTDLLRRRQQVSQMPAQIFQPLYKRQETREDCQREMEFAFEDMYTGERRVKGDLVVRLVPEPLPALSTGSQDQELDVTQDETQNIHHDTEPETSTEVGPSKPRRALKRLLDRIRNQRTNHSSRVPAADSQTIFTDQIPERDTSIETGSLTSEERDKRTSAELREPAISPPGLETTQSSAAADTRLPDVLASRIRGFEEERKRRDEELEREKQQQMFLLQELEEQKVKLEQMLLEAQQEKEYLKAAFTQEIPTNQAEVPVYDQEVTSVTSTELLPPASEENHTRRVREHQQRLLDQNRTHQRSVEVARQRLEEYQRALRIRYNMTATSPPAVVPPGLVLPPRHSTRSVHLPAPPQLPTAAAAVPAHIHEEPQTYQEITTRASDIMGSWSVGSDLLPDDIECALYSPSNQRAEATTWLTDNIMERVTEHLPERLRVSPVTKEPVPYKPFTTHLSTGIAPQSSSDAISPSTADRAPPGERGTLLQGSLRTASLSSRDDDITSPLERQRRELLEVQRRMLEQREAVMLQRRQQEEERWRQEVEMEQMRRQKQMLQALINTDARPVSKTAGEELVSGKVDQNRLQLLASLLRAIEESNRGTLSRLQDAPQEDGSPQHVPSTTAAVSQSNVPVTPAPVSVLLHPPRAAKPPVTRVRLGFMGMTEQHELSAIQEAEIPVDSSQVTGPEHSVTVPSRTAAWHAEEESESTVASDGTLQTSSVSSSGPQTAKRPASSGRSSGRSSHLIWRERLLAGAGTSPESSDSDSVLRIISPFSSDSGRGADFSGPAITSYGSPTECPRRPPESDYRSSTTISTGSYNTTDHEQNNNTEQGSGVSSPSGRSRSVEESPAAGPPGLAVDSLFNDSSIQHIIDRYTRELNISLSTAGKTTDSEGSHTEELSSSESPQSLVRVSQRRGDDDRSASRESLHSDAAAQSSGPEWDTAANPIPRHFPGEGPSLAEDQEHDSFRPLIGQLADQSSCLAAEQRDSALEHLVGQPSAHSSMIAHPPDQDGWDSTLNRMIGHLSHQSSSHWLSGRQDIYAGQLMGQMASEPSTTWLNEAPEEEYQMRPLVGELDESAGQQSGSSGERSDVALGVSTEASVLSSQRLSTEAWSNSPSVSSVTPHSQDQTQQSRTSPMDLDSERAEGSDSFQPLMVEVTHNITADPSMTFHLPEHSEPPSPEGHPASEERSVSTPSFEFETHTDASVGSEPSPERLRAEESNRRTTASPAFHESFSQLITTECRPHESVLLLSPTTGTDVEQTVRILSNLTVSELAVEVWQPEASISKRNGDSVPFTDLCAKDQKCEQGSDQRNDGPLADKILEAAKETGILEQSEISLVSLTDTTLQDQETAVMEEEGVQEIQHPGGMSVDGQDGQETESESTLLAEETPEDGSQTHPVTVLEFQWGPSRDLQQVYQKKRRALLQRSNRRVEEVKAKGALAKIQLETRTPSEAREQCKAKEAPPDTCRTNTKSEPPHKTDTKPKGGQAAHQTTKKSTFIKQKKPQLQPPVSDPRLKKVEEVKICTPEQRKHDVAEMHQRTRRLYEQLEEVKHQKAARSRQDDYAKNRLKAKEFHKKTLQKLRTKKTP
ncbi:uncharacterized protein cep295 [Brachyistius frenatus]|uniref:uncharacterized protein cep295 n=1 Tax=Brachyistius frenatus TaxID=100188 RepID=UPI0037E79430